ncbi:MAG: response regulator, partial [Desulfobacterales bacterium]|nr:response regulator [Desulfobacterales bacterium]
MADSKLNKPLLLIVDDNPTNIDILVNALKKEYRLGVAKNGEKALAYAEKHHPRLILLDIMMPEMDGFEVCARLKDSPETMDIAIIFITAVHETSSKTRGFEMGAVDYITKPFNTTEVIARVRTHLELIECRDRLEDLVMIRTEQLENANRDLAETRLQIIHRLGKVVEYRDNETGKHVIRVSHYSATLAEGLGLPARMVNLIRLCSPMHDVGKIGVPDKILLKTGPLDADEL